MVVPSIRLPKLSHMSAYCTKIRLHLRPLKT